jgi:hypothetical protein
VEVLDANSVRLSGFVAVPAENQYRVLVVAADVSAVSDAGDLTYTPAELTDWDSDADPGDAADALDQLAERVDDLEGGAIADHDHSGNAGDGGTFDAANLTSGAATDGHVLTADGSGGAAWEAPPAGGTPDAGDVTYTPTTAADWDSDTDPGNVDDALDQLAERVDDLEGATRSGVIGFTIDGGGSAITTGLKGWVPVPENATITAARIVADQAGDCVVDIWKDTYANFPPTVADTITASARPTLSSAQKAEDATLTGWTTSLSAGDWLAFNVDSAATVTRVVVALFVEYGP